MTTASSTDVPAAQEDNLNWKRKMEERVQVLEERVQVLEAIINGTKNSHDNPPVSMELVPATSQVPVQRNYCLVEGNEMKNQELKYFVENICGGGMFQPCCEGRAQIFTGPTNGDKYLFINPSPQFEFSFEFHPNSRVKETKQLDELPNKFPQSIVNACALIFVPVTFHYEIHNLKEEDLEAVLQAYPDLKRYKAGKPYTALYIITGGPAFQGILFEGTVTKSLDKDKVPLICQLMNKLTQKIKISGLEPNGKKLAKILHMFGGTVSVPNWDVLVIFWILETIVKKTVDRDPGQPFLNNLDPFSNEGGDLQAFFKKVGNVMGNGGYPAWKEEMNEAVVKWGEILQLEQNKRALPSTSKPAAVVSSDGGDEEENSDSEDSSLLSLFVPVKTKIEKDGKPKRKSVRFGACKPESEAKCAPHGIPCLARRSLRNERKCVNVKIKRKWVSVKINDVEGQQAWENGKKVRVSLVDVKKIEK